MLCLRGGYNGPSFFDLLRSEHSYLLRRFSMPPERTQPAPSFPEGTTILALKYAAGVMMIGDRRATEGFQIADRGIEKVHSADSRSLVAIAGAAGPCLEMVRLFQAELEHYEKIEGETLALEGKANKLAQMVSQNFPAALHGLVVIPIFAGFDVKKGEGRIFKYDVTGGRYEEELYYATGSGGRDARNSLKKLYRDGLSWEEALSVGLEALIDAAEEDAGTGGPDLVRGIYPSLKHVDTEGVHDVSRQEIHRLCTKILEARRKVAS